VVAELALAPDLDLTAARQVRMETELVTMAEDLEAVVGEIIQTARAVVSSEAVGRGHQGRIEITAQILTVSYTTQ
jgi:hypothetical protein